MTAKKKPAELTQNDPEFLPVQFDLTEARLVKLASEYAPSNIPTATEKGDEGYLIVHEKTMAITKVRTNLEKVRKSLKADALAWGKKVDGEAKRLREIIEQLEAPWRALKEDLDEKEDREREQARLAEQQRMEEIELRIADIKAYAEGLIGADAATIQGRLDDLNRIVVNEEGFGEYTEAAMVTGDIVRKSLETALAERQAFERQQAEQAEQQAKLDAQAAEQAEQQRKLDEQKAAQEAAEAAEKARKEKEEREAQEEIERQEREAAAVEAEKRAKAELAERLPEDIKLREYADSLLSVPVPELKSDSMCRVASESAIRLNAIYHFILDNTQEVK